MLDLDKIPFDQSPNYHVGRSKPIKYVLIHAQLGSQIGSRAWFKNPKSQVSAHYLISQTGEILQMVKDKDRAFHCWGVNDESIGCEFEDKGMCMKGPWTTVEQLRKGAELVASLVKKYKLEVKNVIGHNTPWIQKLNPAYAHQDPGPYFDLELFRRMTQKELNNG